MTKVTQSFATELAKLTEQCAGDLEKLVGRPVRFELENQQFRPLQELLVSFAPGAVCCRSLFVRNAHGVGGVLFHQDTVEQITRSMMQESLAADAPFTYKGMGDEAMAEAWNVFVGSWNRSSIPDFRMSASTDERAVEYFPSSIEFPKSAGIFPEALAISIAIGDQSRPCAIFLPHRAIQGSEVRDFITPTQFVRVTYAAEHSGSGVLTGTAAAIAPANPRGAKALAPVIFLDYSGMVIPWLRLKAKDHRLQYVLAEGLELKSPDGTEAPVAAVLAGADLEVLKELRDCAVVEIHRRK